MLRFVGKLPRSCYIAVSGGIDSMVILDFLNNGKRDIHALYFNHGTDYGNECEEFLYKFCKEKNIKLSVGRIKQIEKPKRTSQEEHWRNERYSFFEKFKDKPIITCHHLNDVVENWVFTSLNGNPMLIPYQRDNFIRPFLVTTKKSIMDWATRKEVQWLDDPSNEETKYNRNYIRHVMMPHVLKVNKGIETTIKKKIIEKYKNN